VGLSGAYLVIPAQTMLNENVDKKFLGRVYGMWLAIVNSLAAFPPLILSLIADRFTNISFFVLLLGIFVIYYSYKVKPILSGKSLRK
jgi:MFS family permease